MGRRSYKLSAPTADQVRLVLRYEPETGRLFWLVRPLEFFNSKNSHSIWNSRFAGKEAFTRLDRWGHRVGSLFDVNHFAHRVIWLMQTGAWPEQQIDHINGIASDNRLINLRAVTPSENQRNKRMHPRNSSGVNGVVWHRRERKWIAQLNVDGVYKCLGRFDTIEEAAAARLAANAEHGFSARHGLPGMGNTSTILTAKGL